MLNSGMCGTGLKSEYRKVESHPQNASQHHFCCFLKEIGILKYDCSKKSPTHAPVFEAILSVVKSVLGFR